MLARRAGGEAVFEAEMLDGPQRARTGDLPPETRVAALVREALARYAASQDGPVADYIPILGEADPRLFGLSLAEVDGTVHHAGDADVAFRSEEHTSELQSRFDLVCRLLLEKKNKRTLECTTL